MMTISWRIVMTMKTTFHQTLEVVMSLMSRAKKDDKDKDAEGDQDEEEEDGLSLAEASDNEDLVSLDGDVPYGLIEYDGFDAEADVNDAFENDEECGISSGNDKKRKREEDKRGKRKKLRSLLPVNRASTNIELDVDAGHAINQIYYPIYSTRPRISTCEPLPMIKSNNPDATLLYYK
jgi:hypothetical protein